MRRKTSRSRAETKRIIDRADFLRSLLSEFGAALSGFDPGVAFNVSGERPGFPGMDAGGYFGEHVQLNAVGWAWLEPLLVELREKRGRGKR